MRRCQVQRISRSPKFRLFSSEGQMAICDLSAYISELMLVSVSMVPLSSYHPSYPKLFQLMGVPSLGLLFPYYRAISEHMLSLCLPFSLPISLSFHDLVHSTYYLLCSLPAWTLSNVSSCIFPHIYNKNPTSQPYLGSVMSLVYTLCAQTLHLYSRACGRSLCHRALPCGGL